jgi:hypothetical protein
VRLAARRARRPPPSNDADSPTRSDRRHENHGYDLADQRRCADTCAFVGLPGLELGTHGINAKGHFPTEQAALKTFYLVTRSLDPNGTGEARWITRWKSALNAFAITYADRMPAAENL